MTRILYRGGSVYSSARGATALLVDGDVVVWVGADAAAAGLGEPDVVVELDGCWVAPAFVDAHVHVVEGGLARSVLDLSGETSLSAVLEKVAAAARGLAEDAVIRGTGWDETAWSGEQRAPAPAELDRAAGGRPVYLTRIDLHSAVAGSRLLQAVGLSPQDCPLRGDAHHAVRRVAESSIGDRAKRAAAADFLAAAASRGIAMVHECGGPDIGPEADLAIVRAAAADVGVEVVAYWGDAGPKGLERARALGAAPGGDIFVDGSLGSGTAALSSPYRDGSSGALLMCPEQIAEQLIAATRAGVQTGFHAIGDEALAAVAEGLALAEAVVGLPALAAAAHRIEHAEMCPPSLLPTLGRYGVIASVQPAFAARWGAPEGMYASRVGAERAAAMNNFAALQAAGIPLAFGSDAPVTPLDPWGALKAAVEWSPRLSERAAFSAHTRGGRRAARRDGGGPIEPGSDATFAVWAETGELLSRVPDGRIAAWSTDPRSGAPGLPDARLVAPSCRATVVSGRVTHDAGLHGTGHPEITVLRGGRT